MATRSPGGPAHPPHPAILRAAGRLPFARGQGVRTAHLVTPWVGAGQLLTGITELDPGAGVPLHTHDCEEAVLVLRGEAQFEADGLRHRLGIGDATWTPPGVVHGFSNRGHGRLRIYWAYGSAEATRTITATGVTTGIGAEAASEAAADPRATDGG